MSYAPINSTHDPELMCWVPGARDHKQFPIQNLPLGIYRPGRDKARPGTAIGGYILDLQALSEAGHLPEIPASALSGSHLNILLSLPNAARRALRCRLSTLLADASFQPLVEPFLHDAEDCSLELPAAIGDYTDFYVGIHHAMNVGRQFRPDAPLLPNYKHVPIGYHGRASSVQPSGVPVVRPSGQSLASGAASPSFGPSRRLDYELELGIWVGRGNPLGHAIPIDDARTHVAGYGLLNDWSARDLQAWEYQPLGPFLAKSFQTSVSPWIVTSEAMAPFHVAQPARPADDPMPLPYLWSDEDQRAGALSLTFEVRLLTQNMQSANLKPLLLSRGRASDMYWTVAQIIAHHSSNGCNLRPGDLIGSGTISARTPDGFGSLLELSRGGHDPLELPNGEKRSFLEDGDELIMTATADAEGFASIGFGECRAVVLPARRTQYSGAPIDQNERIQSA